MEKNLKLFMFVNDLQSEDTNKYVKLLYKDKVVAFVDKETGDVLKKKTKSKPSEMKIGNIKSIVLWRIVASTGNTFKGKVIATPIIGTNKVLVENFGEYEVFNEVEVEEVIKISDRELTIRNSNILMNLKRVE